ncbi:MAG: hypothetical protein U9R26_03580 [Campylobacterota bacterium]|nr:hypothetical protein [Campylobacterota bacterium]
MQKLIDDTVEIARKRFGEFGFSEDQVTTLLASGRRDLVKEFEKLQLLLEEKPVNIEAINNSMHALKGLLSNMGNEALAEKFTELRQESESRDIIAEIQVLLER